MRSLTPTTDDGRESGRTAGGARSLSFRRLVETGPELVLVVGRDLSIEYRSGECFGQFVLDDAVTNLTELCHTADASRMALLVDRLVQKPGASSTISLRVGRGNTAWIHAEATITNLLHDDDVRGIVVHLLDVGRWVALERHLRRQALSDPLTGLPNRVVFRDRLEHALARARETAPVVLLFLDLDRFKAINDGLGHAVGDELLVMIADRLKTVVRAGETVARLGGDEFAILIEDVDDSVDAAWVAGRLLEALHAPFSLGATEVHVGASIGLAFGRDSNHDPDELLRNADVAMYEAKGRGGARWAMFEPQMQVAVRERLDLENDLRRAVDRHELFLQYQPLVDLESRALHGVEALLRWRHPRRGVLQPVEFISVAEVTGLIVPIGSWVLERACQEVRGWQRRAQTDPKLKLSVNLSARQLSDPNLGDVVARALRRSGLDPPQLVLELTESSLLETAGAAVDALWRLKQLGVTIAIDDFGTGYSCLSYLQRLPVDILKIDQAFVRGNHDDAPQTRWALAETIVQLASNLGLTTTAEGIENSDQWDALVAMGCQTGQGFHFAHPVDPIDIENLLLANPRPAPRRVRSSRPAKDPRRIR